ncbi:MAG TPA: CoA transferase [Methylomirabilota bacterium]|jgi:crotonobetainyl-CoA:carnitine CoA-transferase CaiB-like acyl-CoA transferase|nr:CoA transferase [Methylomirabilota bacterium]
MSGLPWSEWIREAEAPGRASEKPEALDDLLVLDCSVAHYGGHVLAGFLGELGAEVIKLEPPEGDPARAWGPPDVTVAGEGLAFLAEGRNRAYVTLNLAEAEGRALLRGLAARADVLIEGFPPGQMDAWEIGYRQLGALNPRLVYVALSAHGQFGPRAADGGVEYDLLDQARSGLAFLTGEPGDDRAEARPTRVGSWISAYAQAAWAGVATLGAVHWRDLPGSGGRGQMIDVSGAEALMRYLEYTLLLYHAGQQVRQRTGIFDVAVSVYTFVPVKDGWAFIAGYTDPNFGAVCRVMGRPELTQDPRFRTTLDRTRPENRAALREEIVRWSVNYTASEILARVLADPGPGVVVFGPVNRPTQTLAEEHWWARGCFGRLEDPVYGALLLAMPAWRMTRTPPRLKLPGRPAGYHNGHVYAKYFGFGPERLAELRSRGII